MPCNCGRTPAVQIRELNQKLAKKLLMKKKIEEAEKKHLLREENVKINTADVADTTKISTVKVSNQYLTINYSGSAPPEGSKIGLLSGTALKAAGGKGGLSDDATTPFRSVGYFGVGFGGNSQTGGTTVSNWSLKDIDLTAFTHINIAFLAPGSNGNLICPKSGGARGGTGDSYEPDWLKAVPTMDEDGTPDENGLFYQVLDIGNKKGLFGVLYDQIPVGSKVKIIPSLGGWGVANSSKYGPLLYTMATEAQSGGGKSFNQLITEIKELLNKKYIHGFDVDWEYPGREALVTLCKKNGTSYNCGPNDPEEIAKCPSDSPNCSTFDIISDKSNKTDPVGCPANPTYNKPSTTQINDSQNFNSELTDKYKSFITELKNQCIKDYPEFELSIALAGAPWGLHWYAASAATLLSIKDANGTNSIINFANLMAYDYAGFWTNGYMSSFLGNLTSMETLSNCTSQNGGTSDAAWKGCPGGGANTGVKFTIDGNTMTPSSTSIGCPTLLYNEFQAVKSGTDPASDISPLVDLATFAGNDFYDSGPVAHTSYTPQKTWYNSYITLSIKTIVNLLTQTFKVDSKKLVLGLPYYGRTFQKSTDFNNDTNGLFQAYDYGAPYSYYDIHKKFVVNENNKDVFTVNMTSKGDTEDIVYTTDLLSPITTDMKQEMISYGSINSTKQKVEYAKEAKLGGYMCWHILSDYFGDIS